MSHSTSPHFALVLGSGGVRSIAALGMAEVLAREGIKPDLIVGCSAGAMFGALIAAGHNAAEAVHIATSLWSAEITRKRRWGAIPKMLWPRLCGFDADFALRDDRAVLARLDQAFGDVRLENLRIPLRVTTVDAATGASVVLQQGSLVEALRAAVALPFMFAAVKIDGKRLIDGFVADPLPVSAARDAHNVLALSFASPMPHSIDRPTRMLAQITSTMTNNLVEARLAAAVSSGQRLITMMPTLDRRVGLFDTEAMPYLVDAGRRATEARLPEIFALLTQRPQLAVA